MTRGQRVCPGHACITTVVQQLDKPAFIKIYKEKDPLIGAVRMQQRENWILSYKEENDTLSASEAT